MNFLRLNHFLKLINNFWKKHTVNHVAAPGRAMCHADVSSTNVSMAIVDVSVDLVNVDQVNADIIDS